MLKGLRLCPGRMSGSTATSTAICSWLPNRLPSTGRLQEGVIQRNLFGGGAEIVLSGQICGDVNLQTDSLKLQDGANIAGNLNY